MIALALFCLILNVRPARMLLLLAIWSLFKTFLTFLIFLTFLTFLTLITFLTSLQFHNPVVLLKNLIFFIGVGKTLFSIGFYQQHLQSIKNLTLLFIVQTIHFLVLDYIFFILQSMTNFFDFFLYLRSLTNKSHK